MASVIAAAIVGCLEGDWIEPRLAVTRVQRQPSPSVCSKIQRVDASVVIKKPGTGPAVFNR